MGHCLDREVANSRRGKEIETEAARQAHYIYWCKLMEVPDPCGDDRYYQYITGVYIMFLYFGMNYKNIETIRSSTVSQYAVAINALFTLRGFRPPIEPTNSKNNLGGIIITNRKREEEISVQRNPLSMKIYSHLLVQATSSKSIDSEASLLANCTTLGMALRM